MLAFVVNQINAVPRGIVNGTLNLTDFVGEKLDKIADGLSGKNAISTGTASLDDPILKEHMEVMEKTRRTKPMNYKNLSTVCMAIMDKPDKKARMDAIMKAFD